MGEPFRGAGLFLSLGRTRTGGFFCVGARDCFVFVLGSVVLHAPRTAHRASHMARPFDLWPWRVFVQFSWGYSRGCVFFFCHAAIILGDRGFWHGSQRRAFVGVSVATH